jgi:hypothetical protein
MVRDGVRRGVWLAVLAWMIVLASVVFFLEGHRSQPARTAARARTDTAVVAIEHAPGPSARTSKPMPRRRVTAEERALAAEPVPYIEGLVWGDLDLRDAKALMPDNLYWKLAAPTKDPAVLAEREADKKKRNEQYGRVLSGDASEEEVNAYYDYRQRVSSDLLEMADYLRRRFDSSSNEKLKGMLDLAVKLHTARLAQIPADREAALDHSRRAAIAREEWRKEQEEFANAGAGQVATGSAGEGD